MNINNKHLKMGTSQGSSCVRNSASIGLKTDNIDKHNTAESNPWVFDVQWSVYPQLEGKLKLFVTCNPEFPIHIKDFRTKPTYVRIKVAPSSYGREQWSQDVNSGNGGYEWIWNNNTPFDINRNVDQIKLSDGNPMMWEFETNSGVEYCIEVSWGTNSGTNGYEFFYDTFAMPILFDKPTTPILSNDIIKTKIQDDKAYTTALEFRNTSSPPSPWNAYNSETRGLFFEAACQETESGLEYKYYNQNFKIWSKEEHEIGVNFMGSVSSSMRSTFKGYVEQAVNIINNTINSGFRLKIVDGITNGVYEDIENRRGRGEIQLWWGSYEELWDVSAPNNWRYFGEWRNDSGEDRNYITKGWVKLCTEKVWTMNFQGITWEEIVECLGIGNDMRYDAYSVFSDYWFPAKNLNQYNGTLTPYTKDLNVLRMAYNHNLPSNLEPWDCANRIYAPNGYFSNIHSWNKNNVEIAFDISGLNFGDTYIFKAISLDYNNSSKFTNEIKITIQIVKPNKWVWSPNISAGATVPIDNYGIHPITATEWNNFTSRINEFRRYAGYSNYNFTVVSKYQKFTPEIYNEAVAAIQGVSGYGKYVYEITKDTFAIYNSKFNLNLFNALSNEANAIVGYK